MAEAGEVVGAETVVAGKGKKKRGAGGNRSMGYGHSHLFPLLSLLPD
jgi:hypothetical protein